MHYSAYAFSSNNKPTIQPLQSGVRLSDIGQRRGLSESDIQKIQKMYEGVCEWAYTLLLGFWWPWKWLNKCIITNVSRQWRAPALKFLFTGARTRLPQILPWVVPARSLWAGSGLSVTEVSIKGSRGHQCSVSLTGRPRLPMLNTYVGWHGKRNRGHPCQIYWAERNPICPERAFKPKPPQW